MHFGFKLYCLHFMYCREYQKTLFTLFVLKGVPEHIVNVFFYWREYQYTLFTVNVVQGVTVNTIISISILQGVPVHIVYS